MNPKDTIRNEIGVECKRKNLELCHSPDVSDEDKKAYTLLRQQARGEEKAFLQKALERKAAFEPLIPDADPAVRRYLSEAQENEARAAFYKELIDLDYDFELQYVIAKEKAQQLPQIAALRRELLLERQVAEQALKEAKSEKREEAIQAFSNAREKQRQNLKDEIALLKKARHEGLISPKAFTNEKREKKLETRDEIAVLKRQLPVRREQERLRHVRHRLRHDIKGQLRVLHSDIADHARNIPVEIKKRKPLISYLTWPLPGLGQLLLGQYMKAALFFIGSLFTYLVAIPYALGRQNYRGKGLFGLISLAEGGSRLDRSVIFMVEGVIAIILLLMGLLILYQSYRDVRRVETRMIQGVRKNNWFETKTTIRREGFPFFASAPAALVTIFIVLLPIAVTILISFTNYDPSHQSKFNWTGLLNYKQIVLGQGIAGGPFWYITGWTILWTIFATSLAILIGFVLALLVNQDRIYGKRLFRTVYLLPWAVPAFITIMFFSIMFSPSGPLTLALSSVLGKTVNIKYLTWGTRAVLIFLQGWLGSSYIFLLCTGILQGIPNDLYEAARIDGATGFQATRHITIPILLFQTAPLLIGQYTFNFNNFSIIWLFNGGGPFEPSKYGNIAGSSDLLISYIYKLTIQKQYQGIGSAITLIVSLALIFFTWIGFSRSKAFREEKL